MNDEIWKDIEGYESKYHFYFNNNFENITKTQRWDIVKIQRYKKVLWFYRLKTIYKR